MNKDNPCDLNDRETYDIAIAAFGLLKFTTPPEADYRAGGVTISDLWYDGEESDGASGTSMWCRARVPTGDFVNIRFPFADIKRAAKPGLPGELICYIRGVINRGVEEAARKCFDRGA